MGAVIDHLSHCCPWLNISFLGNRICLIIDENYWTKANLRNGISVHLIMIWILPIFKSLRFVRHTCYTAKALSCSWCKISKLKGKLKQSPVGKPFTVCVRVCACASVFVSFSQMHSIKNSDVFPMRHLSISMWTFLWIT